VLLPTSSTTHALLNGLILDIKKSPPPVQKH